MLSRPFLCYYCDQFIKSSATGDKFGTHSFPGPVGGGITDLFCYEAFATTAATKGKWCGRDHKGKRVGQTFRDTSRPRKNGKSSACLEKKSPPTAHTHPIGLDA